MSTFAPNDVIRIEYTNGVTKMYKNNTLQSTTTCNVGELCAIRFMAQTDASFVLKNMKLWSI